jgi:hypothetical protein
MGAVGIHSAEFDFINMILMNATTQL